MIHAFSSLEPNLEKRGGLRLARQLAHRHSLLLLPAVALAKFVVPNTEFVVGGTPAIVLRLPPITWRLGL